MPSDSPETLLAEKLLRTFHLDVGERATLPHRRIKFSALVEAARQYLTKDRCLPERWTPGVDADGVVIECREGRYWTHTRHEIGVHRFSPPSEAGPLDLAAAVRQYILHLAPSGSIDGIEIAWEE